MIRPEVISLFRRYAEVIAGLLIAVLGFWLLTRPNVLAKIVGALVIGAGLVMFTTSLRRIAFKTDQIGPGVVEVDERQISYFSAYEGGVVSIDGLTRITVISSDQGPWVDDMHWVLEEDGGTMLTIPNSASGTEKLFDAFSALDGVDYSMATKAMGSTENDSYVIWAKPRTALH